MGGVNAAEFFLSEEHQPNRWVSQRPAGWRLIYLEPARAVFQSAFIDDLIQIIAESEGLLMIIHLYVILSQNLNRGVCSELSVRYAGASIELRNTRARICVFELLEKIVSMDYRRSFMSVSSAKIQRAFYHVMTLCFAIKDIYHVLYSQFYVIFLSPNNVYLWNLIFTVFQFYVIPERLNSETFAFI